MALTVTIGGRNYTSYAMFESFSCTTSMSVGTARANLTIRMPKVLPFPQAGEELIVKDGSTTEFGGVILATSRRLWSTFIFEISVTATDYVRWLDKILVNAEYTDGDNSVAAGSMVISVVNDINIDSIFTAVLTTGGGFISATAPEVPGQLFYLLKPSDAITQIASLVHHNWYIDTSKRIHFFAIEDNPVVDVVSTITNNILNLDTDHSSYSDFVIEENVEALTNRVYLRDALITSSGTYTDTFIGNGSSKTFHLSFPPASVADADITVLTVGATTYSVANGKMLTDGVDGRAGETDTNSGKVYVNIEHKHIRFTEAPADAAVITVTYYLDQLSAIAVDDPDSFRIMRGREGGTASNSGVYESVFSQPGYVASDIASAMLPAQLVLARQGRPMFKGSFTSRLKGWEPSRTLQLYSQKLELDYVKVIINNVTKRVRKSAETTEVWTTVEFTTEGFLNLPYK